MIYIQEVRKATFTTVGYGDYSFHTDTEKLFGSIFIFCGVAFVGFSLANIAAYVAEKSEAMDVTSADDVGC